MYKAMENNGLYLNRERINQQLNPENCSLITLSAESGFGKSLSVMQYLSNQHYHVVWVSFTMSNNFSGSFWNNFVASVKRADTDLTPYIEKLEFPGTAQAMRELVRLFALDIERLQPVAMVFDDFHLITDAGVKNFVQELVSSEFDNLCIYIMSRSEVNLPAQSSKTNRKEITAKELAFTIDEVAQYFVQNEIALSYDTLYSLYAKTEGWPTSVYLTLLTMKNNSHLLFSSAEISDELLFDTIEQEVFAKYSPAQQKFILQLSLLEFRPLQMLRDIFGDELKSNSRIMQENVFIRYNYHSRSFQLHQIFRDFLARKLSALPEEEIRNTYFMAAAWYESKGLTVNAIQCYKKVDGYESIWKIILNLLPVVLTTEYAEALIKTMHEFPESFKKDNPLTYVAIASLYLSAGNPNMVYYLSMQTIKYLENAPHSQNKREALGDAYVNLAMYYRVIGDAAFTEYFKNACMYLPGRSVIYDGPFLYLLNGNPISLKTGNEGEMEAWVSGHEKAEQYYSRLLGGRMNGFAALARSSACYYQGDVSKAEEHAYRGIFQGKENRQVDIVCHGYFLLLKIHLHKGNYNKTMEALAQLIEYSAAHNTSPHFHLPDLAKSWLFVQLEINEQVSDWIVHEKTHSMNAFSQAMGFERLIRIFYLLNEGEYAVLIPALEQSEYMLEKLNQWIYLVYAHIIFAVAYYEIKDMNKAIHEFYTAYQMAWENQLDMIFVQYGHRMVNLIAGMHAAKKNKNVLLEEKAKQELTEMSEDWLRRIQTKASSFHKRLIAMREQYVSEHKEYQKQSTLTARERKILLLVSEGFTREEIADSMGFSINTLKSSLNIIYSKLGAINGSHAVRIAMLRGII